MGRYSPVATEDDVLATVHALISEEADVTAPRIAERLGVPCGTVQHRLTALRKRGEVGPGKPGGYGERQIAQPGSARHRMRMRAEAAGVPYRARGSIMGRVRGHARAEIPEDWIEVTCWCEAETVAVPKGEFRRGLTRSCGAAECREDI